MRGSGAAPWSACIASRNTKTASRWSRGSSASFTRRKKKRRPVKTTFDIRDIFRFLPHRYPFLLVDRVVALEEGKQIDAIKNVTYNEPFFVGHFPDVPTMPGVL